MKLKNHFKKTSENKIKKLAAKHHIYYQSNFSRNWISKRITEKLLDKNYLQNLVSNELSTAEKNLLKKLLTTESINIDSLKENNYHSLIYQGLVYERNNFCYLFQELKEPLKDILSTSRIKGETSKMKKFKFKENITVQNSNNLSFFHYLILIIAQIKELSHKNTKLETKNHLITFLDKINSTNLATTKLLNYILGYSYKNNLISVNYQLKDSFYPWLKSSYQEKVITTINTLIPKSDTALRKLIAVLRHYPAGEKIPLSFAYQELNLQEIDLETKELFKLLNIIKITEKNLFLSKTAWQHFNPQAKFKFKKPTIKKNQQLVPLSAKLEELWKIANRNQLININNNLVFNACENN